MKPSDIATISKGCKPKPKSIATDPSDTSDPTSALKLTEAQQVVLVRSSQNEDGELVTPADTDRIGQLDKQDGFGSTLNERRMIDGFLRKGLIEGDANVSTSLRLTTRAFASLHIDEREWPTRLRGASDKQLETLSDTDTAPEWAVFDGPTAVTLRTGSKGAAVLALLEGETGATLAEMQSATGWQAHSVRGFLSGTIRKKLGLHLERGENAYGKPSYRVTGEAPATEDDMSKETDSAASSANGAASDLPASNNRT